MPITSKEAELIRRIDAINSARPHVTPAQHAEWETLVTEHERLCHAQVLRTTTRSRSNASGNGLEDITQGIRRLARVQHRTPAQSAEFSSLCRQSKSMNEAKRATRSRSADPAVRRSTMTSRSAAAADLAREQRAAPAPARSYAEGDRRLMARAKVTLGDSSSADGSLLRDLAMRDIEKRNEVSDGTKDRLDSLLRDRSAQVDGSLLARHIIATGRSAYRSAWLKTLTATTAAFTVEERHAIDDVRDHQGTMARHAVAESARQFAERAAHGDMRAMSESSGSAGLGVPWYLDPQIVVTAGGVQQAQILNYATSVLSTSDNYHAVTAPSTGFSTTAEGAAVGDSTPTFAGPDIQIFKAADYLPFSLELGMDQPGWADNCVTMFSNAYAEYVSASTATGAGGTEPTGIFTRLVNSTNNPSHVTVASAGQLSAADCRKVWTALPERYRVDASTCWLMSPSVESQISALAAPSVTDGLGPQDLTTDTGTGERRLFGRPILSVSDAPAWTGTTGAANVCVVGAFSKYAVATRLGGFSVELIPHLRSTSSGRPTGERAFLATARVGADAIDPGAFRLLANS
jgi:HK97 family phage major capsid protein